MMKLVVAFVMAAALAACGGKSKAKPATPSNTGGATTQPTTDMKSSGTSTGGSTYGGAMAPTGGGADPCAGK